MRRILAILTVLVTAACTEFRDPWDGSLEELTVKAVYPDDYDASAHSGVSVIIENIASGDSYTAFTDSEGKAAIQVRKGIYRISLSDRVGRDIFNGTADKVIVGEGGKQVLLNLSHSLAGTLVIKELYVGGCSKAPQEGTYQSDQYVILHNNDSETVYLDSLCFGTLSPYNATGVNNWRKADGSLPDFAPVVTVVWRFPGEGNSHPLAPGEEAVIALRGAIDHTRQYPLSVNLNREDCFVCYNPTYFPNPLYHPAPGDKIRPDHILDVVVKTGQSNANTVSISSPTFLIFKAKGISMEEYVRQDDIIQVTPGNSADVIVKVPYEWVIDAVEVFDGGSSGNNKRLIPALDAGYVTQSGTFKGHSLMRKTDEEASEKAGYTILRDSNNSSEDFYESEVQSLHN